MKSSSEIIISVIKTLIMIGIFTCSVFFYSLDCSNVVINE